MALWAGGLGGGGSRMAFLQKPLGSPCTFCSACSCLCLCPHTSSYGFFSWVSASTMSSSYKDRASLIHRDLVSLCFK